MRFDLIQSDKLGNHLIWHETVQVFSVWDGNADDAEFVGYLYFDLLWRENKYRGNQNVTIECVSFIHIAEMFANSFVIINIGLLETKRRQTPTLDHTNVRFSYLNPNQVRLVEAPRSGDAFPWLVYGSNEWLQH